MLAVRSKEDRDNDRLTVAWTERYGDPVIVSRGVSHDARTLPGFVVADGDGLISALTWHEAGGQIEVVTLDSFAEDRGAGTALLAAVADLSRTKGVRRLWLITTNDNIRAIRFYQKRGWNLCAVHFDAVTAARKIKPEIPLTGDNDIPIRHEFEFEFVIG
ncbi:MAG TPA: GNAT family N-acetyltransferase [Rhizomicrobium sp.]|jgi:ribosomal protein S18 acetylase RimI-like enzyme